jgi:hypothetical protein
MSTDKSRLSETAEDHRYSEICGATNRNGNPCKLPKGWGTPGSGGTRCKYHGGLSSGPDDTSHLQDNNYAADNDGGAPANNSNAAIHGGFSDWRTAYERFRKDPAARQRIETLVSAYLHTAQEHATDVDLDRRKELARELATRRVLKQRAQEDVWNDDNTDTDADADADADARGLLLEDDDGDGARSGSKVNPAHIAAHKHKQRTREIAKELSLWSGFQ